MWYEVAYHGVIVLMIGLVLRVGSTVYTCMCNSHGGTELDLTVSVLEPGKGQPHDPKFEGTVYTRV